MIGMETTKGKIIFLIILVILLVAFFSLDLHGQILDSKALISEVEITPTPTTPVNILDKILEPDPEFDATQLKIGNVEVTYTEERYTRDSSGKITKSKIKRIDYEKEIALKLLDTVTGQTETIKITKRGSELINPLGYDIRIITRP